jgi:alpha-2-macroglobulin
MEHLERHKLVLRPGLATLACWLLLCITAQAATPYFSVSTDRTFLPGQKATVHLYTRDVNALEFRLYRVNDSMLFFEKLGDPHGFGHATPQEQIEEPTWIERFHDWKHGIWVEIRDFFRHQFSRDSRAEIRESAGQARKSNVSPATMFAQIPLLNSKQLVARWRQEVPPKFFTESQDVPVESLDKGVYVVEATDGNLRAYTLILVTELAVVTKSAPGQLLAFAADRKAGNPIPDTRVEVLATRQRQAVGQTDSQGMAMLTLPNENFEDPRVIAVHDRDVALVAPYYFNISSNPAEDWTGYVYTDRPVYRPTHSVHFRGILRNRAGERYQVPVGKQVTVTVDDPNNKQIFQTSTVISAFGTVHGDFVLPPDAALGYYSISIHTVGTSFDNMEYGMTGGFNVEEYKKPEYEVRVTPDKPRVLQGDSITATIEAKYYFGEPVAGADVKYVVHRSASWSYLFGDQESDFGDEGTPSVDDAPDQGDDYAGEQLSEQSGKLDANGRLKITIPTRLDANKRDAVYRIEARVTDESRREIAGHNSVLATYGSFQVGVEADKYLYQQGETITLTAIARNYDGHPIQTAFHADLVHPKYSRQGESETVLASTDGHTGKDGRATFTLPAKEGGSIIRISATTPENRVVQGVTWLWVAAPGYATWNEARQQQVQIIPDKKSYKVGDTAHLLVMTTVLNAQMLVTTEGRQIETRRVVKGTGTSTMVSVPLTQDTQPAIYVSVAFIHDDTLYSGNKDLRVPADQQKLTLSIQPSQPQFKPGDPARYNILALDANGKPVTGEFSIGVVDEAIYAIHPDDMQDIYQFFYRGVADRVGTESSLSFFFTGEAGTKPMILAGGGGDRHRLAQLKPSEPLVQPKVRKVFPDTALWLADVKTDQKGQATAQLTFPDSLTTWRATVRGVTADTKVGSAVDRVIVRKNLMVRLAVPRFFRQGDDVTVSTIVHNYLTTDKNTQVSLETKGLDLQDAGPRQVTVPTKGDQRQDWHVHAQNVHESDLLAKALTNEESDAMEMTLPVIPFGVKLSDSQSGAISVASGKNQVSVNLPGDPATAAQSLMIDVSPSIAGSIFSALDYLTSYPYGCTEQTMSSFLPNIVVAKAMKDLNLQSTISTPDLDKKIHAGMDRLYDFQHDDGGWGWWKEDESQVFMTAYVVSGLAQAKSAGYEVKDQAMPNAENWLKGQLAQHERMRPDLRAYVVYALALDKASDSKMLDDAYRARKDMSSQGLSMLGLALYTAGDNRAKEVAAQVEKQAVATEAEAHWPSDYDSFLEFYDDDSAEATAYAVRLLSLIHPDSPLLPKAAQWLVNHRDGGYFWLSTKQTAMVVFGLTEYVKVSHELDADFTATVYVNDREVLSRHFTRADAMSSNPPRVMLATDQLQAGNNAIRVEKTGAGRLYWSARGEYYSSDKRVFQNNKVSLNIARDYYRLAPQQKGDKIVYDLVPAQLDEMKSGDVIAVRLSVNGSEWRYLLIEDPFPAGAESIQRDDLYELNTKMDWWGFWFTRREFHDDHAAFFQTYFNGHQEYVYLLKIVNPGKFRISPASAQPMYQPSIISTTDAATMEVKP